MLLVDLRATETRSADLGLLQAYLQQLVGQPFLHLRFSHGDELALHLGQPRACESTRMKHRVKGSYILGTRASRWYLRSEARSLVVVGGSEAEPASGGSLRTLSNSELQNTEVIQPGAQVIAVSVIASSLQADSSGPSFGFGLSVSFSDGASLVMVPVPEASAGEDALADWELFTPYERYLSVGPGLHWSYLPSRLSGAATAPELAIMTST